MKKYATNAFGINVAQKEWHDLRMKQNQQRRAFLRQKAEELEEELTRVKLEIKMNKLEGAAMHNEQVLVLRLPAEITAYVFEVAHGQTRFDDSAEDGPWESIEERPEIVISHVCRSWRSISLAHPALWSHFLHIRSDIPVPLNWMFGYLQRSKRKPLDILLDVSLVPEDQEVENSVGTILDILIPHALRWRRISITHSLTDDDDSHDVKPMPLKTLSAPILEVLEIVYNGWAGPEYVDKVRPIFLGGVPNLVSVRMEPYRCRELIPSYTITTLHLYGTGPGASDSHEPWDAFLLVLATPTLMNLTIEGMCFDPPLEIVGAPQTMQRIEAPSLTNVRLFATHDSIIHYISNFALAPKLELLAIFYSYGLSNSIPMLQDLPLSSFVSLKTLVLFHCNIEIEFLLTLSRVTNGLIHLIIDAHLSMKKYIDHMVRIGPGSSLWPNLETLLCVADIGRHGIVGLDELSLTDCAKVIIWQTAISGKPCIFCVKAEIAQYWIRQSKFKKQWKYLLKTGVAKVADEEGPYPSVIPWPHHGAGHFRVGISELGMEI